MGKPSGGIDSIGSMPRAAFVEFVSPSSTER
jgi:hypothetical protein